MSFSSEPCLQKHFTILWDKDVSGSNRFVFLQEKVLVDVLKYTFVNANAAVPSVC